MGPGLAANPKACHACWWLRTRTLGCVSQIAPLKSKIHWCWMVCKMLWGAWDWQRNPSSLKPALIRIDAGGTSSCCSSWCSFCSLAGDTRAKRGLLGLLTCCTANVWRPWIHLGLGIRCMYTHARFLPGCRVENTSSIPGVPGLSALGGGLQLGYLCPGIWGCCSCIWNTESLGEREKIEINCLKDPSAGSSVLLRDGLCALSAGLALWCCFPSAESSDASGLCLCKQPHLRAQPHAQLCVK